jgi:CubicO group peptidase (beta-lactamase class C family)
MGGVYGRRAAPAVRHFRGWQPVARPTIVVRVGTEKAREGAGMIEDLRIDGTVKPGFEEVRDEFDANFRDRGDVGASVAVYVGGELVVDLWGGTADPATGRPWARDTVGLVYSATKGATATCRTSSGPRWSASRGRRR